MPVALTQFRLAVAVLLLAPAIAQAQGLGRLTLQSSLGQPLRAEVAIVSVQADKNQGVHGSIASPDTYKAMGIEFDPVLFSIQVSVENRGRESVLLLTSTRPIQEPFLDVLIVLQSASGRLIRDYTVLFDSQ